MTSISTPTATLLPATDLGGPGAPDPNLCSQAALKALHEIAGPGLRMTSLALDVASHALGPGEITLSARADKRTRSILFASVEARAGEALVFTAQGLFSRSA